MKKILTLILSLALLCVMAVPAMAADTISQKDGSASANVKGTYVPGSGTATVYSVDIAWGSLEFTYTDASKGTWNPESHSYDGAVAAAWSCEDGADKITVTNHSNAPVNIELQQNLKDSFAEKISLSFSKDVQEWSLDDAENTDVDNAPSMMITVTPSGALTEDTTAGTVIGTITVTLS